METKSKNLTYIYKMKRIILISVIALLVLNVNAQIKYSQFPRTTNLHGSSVPYLADSALFPLSVKNFAGNWTTKAITYHNLDSLLSRGDTVYVNFSDSTGTFITPFDTIGLHNWVVNNFTPLTNDTSYVHTTGTDSVYGYITFHNNIWVKGDYLCDPSNNTKVGTGAGHSLTIGTNNVFLGRLAGYNNADGNLNIAIGSLALNSNISGVGNTAIGYQALYGDTADNNTALGFMAGYNNTTGTPNTFIGYQSGYSNTIGINNVFNGTQTGYKNRSGNGNTFNGVQAGNNVISGSNNVFDGLQAGFGYGSVLGTKSNSVAIGYQALLNDTADNNTALGFMAGYNNTTGTPNTFIGYQSGYNNQTGISNTFLGYKTGLRNIGNYNTAIGESSLEYSASLITNVALTFGGIGYTAGVLVVDNTGTGGSGLEGTYTVDGNGTITGITISSYGSGYSSEPTIDGNDSGSGATFIVVLAIANYNTALGYRAGYNNITGSGSVFLGNNAGYYETGSNTWMLSNGSGSTNLANSRTHAWMWGAQNTDSSTNTCNINASTIISKNLTINGDYLSDANGNSRFGTGAASNVIGNYNTFIGFEAGRDNVAGTANTGVGWKTLANNISGNYNTAVGVESLERVTTGQDNVGFGEAALAFNVDGSGNAGIGTEALFYNVSGGYNSGLGEFALHENVSGNYNVGIGAYSGYSNITGHNNIFLGDSAGYYLPNLSHRIILGTKDYGSLLLDTTKSPIYINDSAGTAKIYMNGNLEVSGTSTLTGNVGINQTAGANKLMIKTTAAEEGAILGNEVLTSWTVGVNWVQNPAGTFLDTSATPTTLTSNALTAVGKYQFSITTSGVVGGTLTITYGGLSFTTGATTVAAQTFTFGGTTTSSTAMVITPTAAFKNGYVSAISLKPISAGLSTFSLIDNLGNVNFEIRSSLASLNNTFIGNLAGAFNTTGGYNSAQGSQSLYSNTTGNNNSAQGTQSLYFNTTGHNNSAQGYQSLYSNTIGNNNSVQGYRSGMYIGTGTTSNTTSDSCTFIGNDTRVLTDNMQNATAIGNRAIAPASNSIQLGNTSLTLVNTSGRLKAGQLTGALTDGIPTAAEINAITSLTPVTAGAGWQCTILDNNGTGLLYKVESDGTSWEYIVMTKAL